MKNGTKFTKILAKLCKNVAPDINFKNMNKNTIYFIKDKSF